MFGLCAPLPSYTGKGQPTVLAPSMLGVLELVTGFLRSPAPAYVGKAQPRPSPTSAPLCSLFAAPQPAYVQASRRYGHVITSASMHDAEGR